MAKRRTRRLRRREKVRAASGDQGADAGYNNGVTDRGYAVIDYSGLFFLVLAALVFTLSWYKRAFTFAHGRRDDEEASRTLLAAPESRIASRSVTEERYLSPAGRIVLIGVFFVLTAMMIAAPVATYLVAKRSFDRAGASNRYSQPPESRASPVPGPLPR